MSTELLNPDNHALLLIDHQYLQLLTVKSSDPGTVMRNALAVAKAAKIRNVPTLLTTGFAQRQPLIQEIADMFPEQEPIDRLVINSWADERVVEWVRNTGRQRLVMAGLWTETCLQLAVMEAIHAGYEVSIIADASGGANRDTHDLAVQRMVQAGASPLSADAYMAELQNDAPPEQKEALYSILIEEETSYGLAWVPRIAGQTRQAHPVTA